MSGTTIGDIYGETRSLDKSTYLETEASASRSS